MRVEIERTVPPVLPDEHINMHCILTIKIRHSCNAYNIHLGEPRREKTPLS